MRYSATQNPANKVGRNSGAGPAGVSEIVPTAQEAANGLQPLAVRPHRRWTRPLALGVSALALVGAGALAVQKRRQQRTLRGRVQHFLGL